MLPEDPVGGGVDNKRYQGKERQGEEARGGRSNPAQLQSQLPLRHTDLKSRLSLLCGSSSVRLLVSSCFLSHPHLHLISAMASIPQALDHRASLWELDL